ncbi:hypothetical protein AQUCO_03700254v1 [Aquilegia coerulea]|uniref:Uncharacterized protein n=1 Tax=Aquilegia coerulea TaxID=218851 RepID=A0A2G5CVC9_AQUCA|nr:hypothetical protein AQUCO_03700254v1 [Aquilegia coerulea]
MRIPEHELLTRQQFEQRERDSDTENTWKVGNDQSLDHKTYLSLTWFLSPLPEKKKERRIELRGTKRGKVVNARACKTD